MKASSRTEIAELLRNSYDIESASVERLEGSDCVNYLVISGEAKFVLKLNKQTDVSRELLRGETALMGIFAGDSQAAFPKCVTTVRGKTVGRTDDGWFFRLLTFVEGVFLAETAASAALYQAFGRFLAKMNRRAFGVRNAAVEARRLDWDLQYFDLNKPFFEFIDDPCDRRLIEYFYLQFKEQVEPNLEDLRKCFIHADAHDWNVLTTGDEVTGIIDFGDVSYSPLINELAVAAAYVMPGKEDILESVVPLIKGYNSVVPLEEKEISLLFYLIATRLSITVCHSAKARKQRPDEVNLTLSEPAAWKLLRRFVSINPLRAEDVFRRAAGMKTRIKDSIEADFEKRGRFTSKALSVTFSRPIKMTGAAFQFMYDSVGNSYLDCYNNIPHVGHCHPRVVDAGQRAMARLNTNTRYLNDAYNSYAENLSAKFPAQLNKVFFVNSGSAASDLAIRLAMVHTRNKGVMVMEHGYHGNTRLGIEISHYKYRRRGGQGRGEGVIESPIPDTYKGEFQGTDAGAKYANKAVDSLQGVDVAAFIAEPIVGCGGQVPLAEGFLRVLYPEIRKRGGVCISDEVQTGFGRLGRHFWGFEMHGVEPDIVVLGKPMGNGHPLAAVVTTDEIAESFETGMEFFSSFGGNTVSMAIGQSVLDVLERERLPENAEKVGQYLHSRLQAIVDIYDTAGNARGTGLFLGLELIKDCDPRRPNTELALLVKEELREKGILVGIDGPFENVVKIKPPICFTKENADRLADAIEEIVGQS